MPSYPCRHPTCGLLMPLPGYCSAHLHLDTSKENKRIRDAKYDRETRDKESVTFYNSTAWKSTRNNKLQQDPVCQVCNRRLANEVHHDVPIREDPTKRLDWQNLVSTCGECHKRLELRRRHQRTRSSQCQKQK